MAKTRKTTDIPTPIAKVNRRAKMLVRRALRLKDAGSKAYEDSRKALTLALQNGLRPGQAVEIEVKDRDGSKRTELFAIRDNFVGDVAFKKAYVSRYELTEVPKFKRVANAAPEAAAQPVGTQA